MYIRFVINQRCEESNQKLGIMHAVRYLRDDDELTEVEFKLANRIMTWYGDNLESPLDYLNKQKSKKSDVFISWFKDSAKEHINKARELAAILENKDTIVEMITTDKPGKVVYEDQFQIFSRPYKVF